MKWQAKPTNGDDPAKLLEDPRLIIGLNEAMNAEPEAPVAPPDPVIEAQRIIEAAKVARAQACEAEIIAVLAKHNCMIMWRVKNQSGNQVEYGAVIYPLDNAALRTQM